MTLQPPVPEANQSPYPIEEPPHEHVELPPVAETADDESHLPSIGTSALLGMGAVAIGAVATAATLFLARRDKPAKRAAAKPKARAKPKAKGSKKAA